MSRVVGSGLFIAGLILLGLSGYYIFQIIYLNLWDDITLRVVSVLNFIGGGIFVALSRILKNQMELIELLRGKKENR